MVSTRIALSVTLIDESGLARTIPVSVTLSEYRPFGLVNVPENVASSPSSPSSPAGPCGPAGPATPCSLHWIGVFPVLGGRERPPTLDCGTRGPGIQSAYVWSAAPCAVGWRSHCPSRAYTTPRPV